MRVYLYIIDDVILPYDVHFSLDITITIKGTGIYIYLSLTIVIIIYDISIRLCCTIGDFILRMSTHLALNIVSLMLCSGTECIYILHIHC